MRQLFLLLCFIILQPISAQQQQTKDSLISLIKTSRAYYKSRQLDESYKYAKESYYLAKQLQEDSLQVRIVGTLSYLEPDLEKAFAYLKESEPIAIRNNQWKYVENIYFARASIYFNNSDDKNALIHFLKLDSLVAKRNDNPFLSAMSKEFIVKVLHETRSENDTSYFPQMNKLIAEGLRISDSLDLDVPAAILLQRKAYVFAKRKQPQKAIAYYKKALERTEKHNNQLRKGIIYDEIAKIYETINQQDSALLYYKKQLTSINQTVDTVQIAITHYKVAEFYNKVNQPKIALDYLTKSQELFKKAHYIREEEQYNIQEILADIYYNLGDYKQAFEASKEAQRQLKIIQLNSNKENVKELEAKYQTDKKEQEIALLKSEKQLAEQQRKNQRNTLLAILGITTIGGIFLFTLYQNRKKTANKLKQLDTAKSKFFTNISHEFRTPLTLIKNPIEDAIEDDTLSDKKRAAFKMAKRNSDRLLSLVNQLLDLSKIDAGKRHLKIQQAPIVQLVSAVSDGFSYQANQKNITYSLNTENSDALAYYDKDAIEKIVVNLLSNAIKYTPKKGHISCSTSIKNETFYLEVKNSGKGLSNEECDAIFKRFYQTSEDNIGSGIGLALVKELVDLHKGRISVESELNQWTKFTLQLPVDKHSFKNETFIEKTTTAVKVNNPNYTVVHHPVEKVDFKDNDQPILLIVEDNADVRALLKQTFEDQYNILTAENGDIGIKLAIEHIPDIIISDIMMPVKDGIALTQELKTDERTSHIPIILLTAKAGEENELKGVQTGADDYITKPFSSKVLISKTKTLINIRKKLQERYSQELVLTPKDIAVSNIDETFLKKVQNVLDEKLIDSSFTIETFCQDVTMSRMQLHRKIKALTGLSTSEFIRSQRLKLAAELLKTSDVTISEIGYAVGFNDRSYFTKCFRETYGMTPTAYAKEHE